MRLLHMRFFYVKNKKFDSMPIRSVRRQGAFINPSVPRAIALPVLKVGKKVKVIRLDKKKWPGIKLAKLALITYPTVKEYEWYTYRKINGKLKRVTLSQYLRKKK